MARAFLFSGIFTDRIPSVLLVLLNLAGLRGAAHWCWVILVGSLLGGSILANEVPPSRLDFDLAIRPILEKYCVRCHGAEEQESMVRLDNLSRDVVHDRSAAESWFEVRNVINGAEMPPAEEPQLSSDELTLLLDWLNELVDQAVEASRTTAGRSVLRRMTRDEYQNTMKDLLGVEMDYAGDLPPDGSSASGFSNNAQSLQVSPIQMEYYLENARRALGRVIVEGATPEVFDHEFPSSNLNDWLGDAVRSNRLQRKQEFLGVMRDAYPETGEFRIRVTVSAELKPEKGFPLLEVSLGYRPDTEILLREFPLIEISTSEEQTFEFFGRLEEFPLPVRGQGKYPGLVVRVRNRYSDGSPLPAEMKNEKNERFFADEEALPVLVVKNVQFTGPYFDAWPPQLHRSLLPLSSSAGEDEIAYVRQCVESFLPKAFRRPVSRDEVERYVGFFDEIRSESPNFEEAIRETFAFILISPSFLYLLEPAGDEKRDVNAWEFASRLSYFLWSTMPDERLLELAQKGQLSDARVVAEEVNRMIADPRSLNFVTQFTDQWLRLETVDHVAINRDYYPEFDEGLKLAMKEETRGFVAKLLEENQSVQQLIAADFAILNESLARHYGVQGVQGNTMRKVFVGDSGRRGGLLSQGSFLLANSTGSDSHPIRRAVWIRDRILDDPPAPPPPDVPTLEEAGPEFQNLTIREQLIVHRNREACNRCHRGIDPWGIALENYDAVGRFRETIRRKVNDRIEEFPVVNSDELPSGLVIQGLDSLVNHISSERVPEIARGVVRRLLIYSLGRPLEITDEETIENILENTRENGYALKDLVVAVATCKPFSEK